MVTSNRRDFIKSGTTAGIGFTVNGLFSKKTNSEETSGFNRIVYRDLGSTGYKVSEIGFGAMNMRNPELVHAAVDKGINYIDTAYVYMNGQNEEVIGQVMKTKRDKVFLTTKVGRHKNLKDVSRQIETSLKRLQTDHVDLLLLHRGGDTPEMVLNEDYMKVMDTVRQKGYTRFVGFSTHSSDPEVFNCTINSRFWEAVLLCYNYHSPPSLTVSIEKMRKAGLAVICMKALINMTTQPPGPIEDIRKDKNEPVSYAQALLKWVLANPHVDTIIPGMNSFEQLAENIGIMGTKMSYEDSHILYRFSEHMKRSHCFSLSGCTGCSGQCPKGVNVCEINRCLGYAYGYRDMRLAWENYRQLPQSSRVEICRNCIECVVKCVNGQNLTANIKRAKEIFT